jgi:hypothetical protein
MKSYLAENTLLLETTEQIEGVRVGKVVNVDEAGRVFVDFPGNAQGPVAARFTNSMKLQTLSQAASAGREVLIVFESNDPKLPIIIDMIHSVIDKISEPQTIMLEAEKPEDIQIDGKRVAFDAKEEIVLRCGKASITLTSAGKVLIRGTYVLSRSSGVNKIKGGSIQLN